MFFNSLTQLKKHKFTLLTKVKILKTFIYPKLAFHLYCESLKPSFSTCFMFDKMVHWFFWDMILYSSVWYKEIQLQSPTSQILQDALFVSNRFNLQLGHNTTLSTLEIYHKFPLPSSQFTPSQQTWIKLYNVDFKTVFNLIHNFKICTTYQEFSLEVIFQVSTYFPGSS